MIANFEKGLSGLGGITAPIGSVKAAKQAMEYLNSLYPMSTGMNGSWPLNFDENQAPPLPLQIVIGGVSFDAGQVEGIINQGQNDAVALLISAGFSRNASGWTVDVSSASSTPPLNTAPSYDWEEGEKQLEEYYALHPLPVSNGGQQQVTATPVPGSSTPTGGISWQNIVDLITGNGNGSSNNTSDTSGVIEKQWISGVNNTVILLGGAVILGFMFMGGKKGR